MAFLIVLLTIIITGFWFWRGMKGVGRIEDGSRVVKFPWARIPTGLVIGFVVASVLGGFGTVPTGHRGIHLRWNAPTGKVLNQGIYYVMPFVENVYKMSVQVKAHHTKAAAASKDLQNVSTEVTLNYAVQPDKASSLFRDVGAEYEKTIIEPAVLEAVKATTANYNAENLVTERSMVKDKLQERLSTRLATHGIVVDAVSITDFTFSPEFTQAIELKVTATQNAMAAENNLKKVKFEAEQAIAKAQGEAEAIRIQVQAIQQQGGKDYVALKAIEVWDGKLPTYMLGSNTMPFITIPSGTK
jgi:regulator of protease activity HflC (stomatin/prohibitin superfamily)